MDAFPSQSADGPETGTAWNGFVDYFARSSDQTAGRILKAMNSDSDQVQSYLEQFEAPAYIKSADGQILAANGIYHKEFGQGGNAIGRFSADFLNSTIKVISEKSDAMVLAGCQKLDFWHLGMDCQGREVVFRTIKRSLLGHGNSRFAIIGFSKVVEIRRANAGASTGLYRHWTLFQQLESRDQRIAKLLAQGISTQEIAEDVGVSRKTIETRRANILETFAATNPYQLVSIMVRLQDAGYSDFGL